MNATPPADLVAEAAEMLNRPEIKANFWREDHDAEPALAMVTAAWESLREHYRQVWRMLYALNYPKRCTIEEIVAQTGLTQNRVEALKRAEISHELRDAIRRGPHCWWDLPTKMRRILVHNCIRRFDDLTPSKVRELIENTRQWGHGSSRALDELLAAHSQTSLYNRLPAQLLETPQAVVWYRNLLGMNEVLAIDL